MVVDQDTRPGNQQDVGDISQQEADSMFAKRLADQTEIDNLNASLNADYKGKNGSKTNNSGDGAVDDQKQDPSSKTDTSTKPKKNLGPVSRRAVKRALMRKYGATGGGIGGILLTMLLVTLISGPATVLINIARKFKNANGLGDHLVLRVGESYVASLLKGDTRSCAESRIKCKFKTISDKQLKNYEKRGLKITYDTTKLTSKVSSKLGLGDRFKMRRIEFTHPDGRITDVKSLFDYKNLKYTDPVVYNLLKRWPVRSYLAKYAPFRWFLGKYALDKANALEADQSTDPKQRKANTDKAMDEHTNADTGADEAAREASVKQSVEEDPKVKGAPDVQNKSSLKTMAKYTSPVIISGIIACMSYDIVNATAAGVQLLWYKELAQFAFPFAQIGSQLADQGNATPETAEYFANRVTTADTTESVQARVAAVGTQLADAQPLNAEDSAMVGKTALDAPAMMSMLNGDNIPTDTGYAANYNAWSPAAAVRGAGLIKSGVDQLPGGKTSVRVACQGVKALALIAIVAQVGACATGSLTIVGGLACLAKIGIQTVAVGVLTSIAAQELVKAIAQPAISIIAKAHLNHDLVGMPLGQAIGTYMGIAGAEKDRNAGFGFAGTKDQALSFYNNIKDDYTQERLADAQYQAKQNQFDTTNQYSFAGRVVSLFNPYASDGTVYSSVANILSVGFSPFGQLQPSANAASYREGLFEPIESFVRPGSLEGSFNVCKDPFKAEIGLNCMGESGKLVTYMSPMTLKCMQDEQQDGKELCIDKAIDYLSGNNPDNKVYIDKDSGEPTDWGQYNPQEHGKAYNNDLLMLMENCRDRLYDVGYTDTSFDDDNDAWYSGARCAGNDSEGKHIDDKGAQANSGSGVKLASASNSENPGNEDTKLAWMYYYLSMCSVYKDEEDVPECWSEPQDTTSSVSQAQEQTAQQGNYKSTQ